MARRKQRDHMVLRTFVTAAIGNVDQDNLQDATVPGPDATLLQATFTTKTAGATTGTFSVAVTYEEATPVTIGAASAGTFIDADAVAGIIHGTMEIDGKVAGDKTGEHIGITTVKTGTVSTGVVLIVQLLWQL